MSCWYKNGIFFSCKKCGCCCKGFEGFVFLSTEECKRIIDFLKIDEESFFQKYTRKVGQRISLKELTPNYECIFLKNDSCQIYEVRPSQCKNFPFWKESLKSIEAFKSATSMCRGFSTAKLITFEEIEKISNSP